LNATVHLGVPASWNRLAGAAAWNAWGLRVVSSAGVATSVPGAPDGSKPLALLDRAFYLVLVHGQAIYGPRFLPTFGHPYAVALPFAHCDQLAGGLAPPRVRPCWAHMEKQTAAFVQRFFYWRICRLRDCVQG